MASRCRSLTTRNSNPQKNPLLYRTQALKVSGSAAAGNGTSSVTTSPNSSVSTNVTDIPLSLISQVRPQKRCAFPSRNARAVMRRSK